MKVLYLGKEIEVGEPIERNEATGSYLFNYKNSVITVNEKDIIKTPTKALTKPTGETPTKRYIMLAVLLLILVNQ